MSRGEQWRREADRQAGVISRRQLHDAGLSPGDLQRLVRRHELTRTMPGVFVVHSGTPTWLQRAWSAVLACEPAALFGASAFRAYAGPGLRGHDDAAPIHVAVDRQRSLRRPSGVVLHRVSRLEERARLNYSPPRMRIEEALLDMAIAAGDELETVSVLSRGIGSRLTTAERVRRTLDDRSRVPGRALLTALLDDIAVGACSALEHAYLTRVERPHGLGHPWRQVRDSERGPIYRDVEYPHLGIVIELDGRADHTALEDRDRDLDRDLAAVVEGKVTARLGWGQVVGRPCETAVRVHRLLSRRGWTEPIRACAECAA